MSSPLPTSSDGPVRVDDAVVSRQDRRFWTYNGLLSASALLFLGYVLLGRRGAAGASALDVSWLPSVNAALNAISATLLVGGWIAIRRGARRAHPYFTTGAFVTSSLFLVCYLVYHWVHGDTRYHGPMRGLYLAILASHVLLSTTVVPLCLAAFWFAWRRRFDLHRRIGRVLMPIWLYVSVTGVVIYFFLRPMLTSS